jgi:hypothetical protein
METQYLNIQLKFLVALMLVTINFEGYSQIEFENHVITADDQSFLDFNLDNIKIADIDGDNYPDLITGKYWFKNLDGLGNFGTPNQIYSNNNLSSFCLSDIDNDNDTDIIGLNSNSNQIVWIENTGSGNFSISTLFTLSNIHSSDKIILADLNNDNLKDIIYVSNSGKISWYQNNNGEGSFGSEQIIGANFQIIYDVVAADIDGDSDLDVLLASGNDTVTLYNNINGEGTFDSGTIINQASTTCCWNNALYIDVGDIDGDGDLDILTSGFFGIYDPWLGGVSLWESYVAWQENIDGLGNFSEKNVIYNIPNDFSGPSTHSFFEDMDNDNDLDIVIGKYQYNDIYYYENIDNLGYSELNVIQEAPNLLLYFLEPSDINGDGKVDILYTTSSGNSNSKSIGWLENLGISLSNQESNQAVFTVSPNPVNDIFKIESNKTIEKVDIYGINGNLILTIENKNIIDVSQLSSGFYIVNIQSDNKSSQVTKIIKI